MQGFHGTQRWLNKHLSFRYAMQLERYIMVAIGRREVATPTTAHMDPLLHILWGRRFTAPWKHTWVKHWSGIRYQSTVYCTNQSVDNCTGTTVGFNLQNISTLWIPLKLQNSFSAACMAWWYTSDSHHINSWQYHTACDKGLACMAKERSTLQQEYYGCGNAKMVVRDLQKCSSQWVFTFQVNSNSEQSRIQSSRKWFLSNWGVATILLKASLS